MCKLERIPGILSLLLALLMACNGAENSTESTEAEPQMEQSGEIKYAITYPHNELGTLASSMAPSEMVLKFKGSKFMTIASNDQLIRIAMLCDTKEHSVEIFMDGTFYNPGLHSKLSKEDIESLRESLPLLKMMEKTHGDSTLGHTISRYQAEYPVEDSLPAFEVVASDEITLSQPNWFNNYSELDKVLLNYEMMNHGLIMHLEATEVELREVNNEEFALDNEFKTVPFEVLNKEMEQNIHLLLR